MQYRSLADLGNTIQSNLARLPQPIDLVVGIPRSGLLAANILSLALNTPMADLDGFCAGRLLATGKTRRHGIKAGNGMKTGHVLVIDDSIFMGSTMREARQRIAAAGIAADVHYVAVFGNDAVHPNADLVMEAVPQPRFFQWNVMHHGLLEHSCLDIDGVVCRDPIKGKNDAGPNDGCYLDEDHPLMIPTLPVGWLVTDRPAEYRSQTEKWLAKWDLRYRHLLMPDGSDADVAFKATAYAGVDALLFIESKHGRALEIASRAGKPVLCTHCFELIRPDPLSLRAMKHRVHSFPKRFLMSKTPLTNPRAAKLWLRGRMGERLYERMKRLIGRGS